MSEKRPVLYTNLLGRSLLFDENGIHQKNARDIDIDRDFDGLVDMWSLVDTADTEPIPLSVTYGHPFSFVFAPPKVDRLRTLYKHDACEWIMALWSEAELLDLYVSVNVRHYICSLLDFSLG